MRSLSVHRILSVIERCLYREVRLYLTYAKKQQWRTSVINL